MEIATLNHAHQQKAQKHGLTIAVFADTHGITPRFREAIAMADTMGADLAIHLGDCIRDTALFGQMVPEWPLYRVRGNNDFDARQTPTELVLALSAVSTPCPVKIYATHGHIFPYYASTERLCYRARELGAGMALCGHSHTSSIDHFAGVSIVNSGSVSLPRDGSGGSFALLRIRGAGITPEIHSLGR